MRLTEESFMAGRSDNGGWSHEQLHLVGVRIPLKRGWQRRLLAAQPEISDEAYRTFLSLRNKHLGPKKVARIAARRSLQESFKDATAHLRAIVGRE